MHRYSYQGENDFEAIMYMGEPCLLLHRAILVRSSHLYHRRLGDPLLRSKYGFARE